MSSSAFSLSAAIPAEGFEITSGEPVIGGLRGATKHYFCGECMSWMFTRPEGVEWRVNIRPTMLDERIWCEPFIEIYTSEKLPWATTTAMHSYQSIPPMEEFQPLIEAFAAR